MIDRLASIITHYTWDLAYFDFVSQDIEGFDYRKLHYIKNPYRTKWFADPFILDDSNDELVLLVEEFDRKVNRGRIARLVVNKKTDTISDYKIVLSLPTHLSFPAIYRVESKILVHPENSSSGASFIYEYDESSVELINPVCVLNEPVIDAVIRKHGDRFILSATIQPDPNGNTLRNYSSDNLLGPYTYLSEVSFVNNTARMAGLYISIGNKLIRPAQDCNGAYGKAVVFYDDHKVLGRLTPNNKQYCGIHTFNVFHDIGIIDLKKWDYPHLVAFKDAIKSTLKR